jgi:hypothetical protein
LALIGTLAAIAMVVFAAPAPAASPPHVTRLSYFVRDDGQLPHTLLMVDANRADRVRATAFYKGRHAGGRLFYDDRISRGSKHPWVLKHQDGDEAYRLIRRSLAHRGFARVRVRAHNEAGRELVKFRIRESQCTKDPPFYPLTCEGDNSG